MKLAYVTVFDAEDIRNWSGINWYIYKSLESQGVQVELIGNLRHGRSLSRRVRKMWSAHVERKNFLHFWDLDTARDYSADVDRRLKEVDVDAVLGSSPVPFTFLKSKLPKILWTDASFSGLSQLYDEFNPAMISGVSAWHAKQLDRLMSENCDLLIYSSQWAAEAAAKVGNVKDRSKLKVVPLGANISINHTLTSIPDFVSQRSIETIHLLFVGVDWVRKGAEKAVQIAAAVEQSGHKVELTIVGCSPPPDAIIPSFVRIIKHLDKSFPEDQKRLNNLYANSHFLLVPTKAEAYGLVFAEASAFGVPSLSHRIGGVPSVVRENVNGFLFDLDEPISKWSECINAVFDDKNRLQELALSSYQEYSSRLNWSVAAREIVRLIDQLL